MVTIRLGDAATSVGALTALTPDGSQTPAVDAPASNAMAKRSSEKVTLQFRKRGCNSVAVTNQRELVQPANSDNMAIIGAGGMPALGSCNMAALGAIAPIYHYTGERPQTINIVIL